MECIIGRYTPVLWTELYLGGIHPVDSKDVSFVSIKVSRVVSPRFCRIDHGGNTPTGLKGHMSFVFNKVSTAVLLGGGQTDPSNIMHLPKCGNELVDVANF